MIFKWETEKERLKKFMAIPPGKKLELLKQMHEFTAKFSSKKTNAIRKRLKELQ